MSCRLRLIRIHEWDRTKVLARFSRVLFRLWTGSTQLYGYCKISTLRHVQKLGPRGQEADVLKVEEPLPSFHRWVSSGGLDFLILGPHSQAKKKMSLEFLIFKKNVPYFAILSLPRKCSSLQQEVRGFSIFALFSDWAGGFDQVMSAL